MPKDSDTKEPGSRGSMLRTGDHTDAVLAPPHYAAFFHYVEGARSIIEMIVGRFMAGGRDHHLADTLILPLGLQCRHLVELWLKDLYHDLSGAKAPHTHRLLELWRLVRPLIERRWPSANTSTQETYERVPPELIAEAGIVLRSEGRLDRAEALITALHEIDPAGLSFRYPDEMPAGVQSLSLELVAGAALELDSFFDAFSTAVYEEDSLAAELEAEAAAEIAGED